MIPPYRTHDYTIWRACERFHILPPSMPKRWEDMTAWQQSSLISYDQIRQHEENEELKLMAGAR